MFNKEIRKSIASHVAYILKTDKADSYMAYFQDFCVDKINVHVECHYGTSLLVGNEYVPTVWAVTAWIGDYVCDDNGAPEIPDEAPYITRECAAPGEGGVWTMSSDLVERLVYDVLNIA